MKLIDSHAHYYDRRFDNPEEGENAAARLSAILAPDSPIGGIVNVGTNPTTSRLAVAQAAQYQGMVAAIGMHPEDAIFSAHPHEEMDELETWLRQGKEALRAQKIVALGEIGLDYDDHGAPLNKPLQKEIFERQLSLAVELNLPVIIHDRDAHGDIMDFIRKYPDVRGVVHSFSGSREMAEELVSLGYMISFSGTLTFKNARRPKEAAAAIPRSSVLVETDCPYLAPHPYRGKLNHSGYLPYTVEALAEIWGVTPDECAQITEENAKSFFGV
jgi:TatD DNase family protein